MNRNTQSVSRNGNQGGSGRSRLESAAGSQSLGRFRENTQALGAGTTSTARPCHDQAPGNHRCLSIGGQASGPGLFGIPGTSTHQPQAKTPATSVAAPLHRDRFEVSVPVSERDELFDESPVQMTPTMHAAARAADERDRRSYIDDEEADFARHCVGAGVVEFTMAMEGN